jgi:anti-anti-sigma factor
MAMPLKCPLPHRGNDHPTVVHFTGTNVSLDEETITYVRDELLDIALEQTTSPLVLDFKNVAFVSSVALGMVLRLYKQLLGAGRQLTLHSVRPQVHEIFTVTGLDQLINVRKAEAGSDPVFGGVWTSSSTRILVVDDEAAVRAVLEAALRREGFMVWQAACGQQAVDVYRRHLAAIAVILLDVRMPDMDGPRTLCALKQLSPGVRCCFMTGNPAPYTPELLMEMGALRVFQKPLVLSEVVEVVSQAVGRSARRIHDRWIEIPCKGE